ncbi:hypothetical protein LTR37_002199, partial [Vermiconidia calcicola]
NELEATFWRATSAATETGGASAATAAATGAEGGFHAEAAKGPVLWIVSQA